MNNTKKKFFCKINFFKNKIDIINFKLKLFFYNFYKYIKRKL